MTQPVLLYITAENREEAIFIARSLLDKRLVACVNILDHMTALYRWNDEIEQRPEVVLIAKTFENMRAEAEREIRAIHSYDCPAILALPLSSVTEDYLGWMKSQLAA